MPIFYDSLVTSTIGSEMSYITFIPIEISFSHPLVPISVSSTFLESSKAPCMSYSISLILVTLLPYPRDLSINQKLFSQLLLTWISLLMLDKLLFMMDGGNIYKLSLIPLLGIILRYLCQNHR